MQVEDSQVLRLQEFLVYLVFKVDLVVVKVQVDLVVKVQVDLVVKVQVDLVVVKVIEPIAEVLRLIRMVLLI